MGIDHSRLDNSYGLTPKEEEFCQNYVYVSDFDAYKAISDTFDLTDDWNKRTKSAVLMRKKNIRKRINDIIEDRNNQTLLDRMYVIKKWKKIVHDNIDTKPSIAQKVLGDIAKHLGMFTETIKLETSSDAGSIAKKIFDEARENEKKLSEDSKKKDIDKAKDNIKEVLKADDLKSVMKIYYPGEEEEADDEHEAVVS